MDQIEGNSFLTQFTICFTSASIIASATKSKFYLEMLYDMTINYRAEALVAEINFEKTVYLETEKKNEPILTEIPINVNVDEEPEILQSNFST